MNNEPDYDNLYFEEKKMTQRIFDVENADDMEDLWDILPDKIIKITKPEIKGFPCFSGYDSIRTSDLIKINWHDKTEITRPIQEATEADIGKLCIFWDSEDGIRTYGILQSIGSSAYRLQNTYPYSECYHHCRRLTKQEIEELC